MTFKNYTPHVINVTDAAGNLLQSFPSVGLARVNVTNQNMGNVSGIPIFSAMPYTQGASLPDPQDGVGFIVSTLVRQAFPDRFDLYSPGQLIRDDSGQPVGCYGLIGNY